MSRVSVTVWAVELGSRSTLEEVQGSLDLEAEALVFRPRNGASERRYVLREISRVRRLRGSPVLLIVWAGPDGQRRTAFYFVPPPPLERGDETPRPTLGGLGRSTKRKVRRQNASYLGMVNRQKKALIRDWEHRVATAVAAARG